MAPDGGSGKASFAAAFLAIAMIGRQFWMSPRKTR
jgi:hypothetical protein